MEKKPTSRVKIRFQDCDPFNHLNNGRFLDYFFNAREDHLTEHYNLDIFTQLKKTGCAWVVASNQIAYLKPAMVAEEVVIETKLIDYSERALTAEMLMWNTDQTHLKAVLWVKFSYFEFATQKSAVHSEELLELFQQVVVPVEATVFENRVGEIMQLVKSGNAV